jgi:hypothetical protein
MTTTVATPPISTQGGPPPLDRGVGVTPVCRRVFFESIASFYNKPRFGPVTQITLYC